MIRLATIPIAAIATGQRFRTDFSGLEELAASIKERGLISPLAVEALPDGTYLLLAGERRLRACQSLALTEVPVRIFDEGTSELERRLIEAAENFDRKDMTWQERCLLTDEIHRLKQSIHGPAMRGSGEGWGVADTAKMAGVTHPVVVQELQLAQALRENPELFAACKNKAEAEKTMRKIEEAIILDELARRTTSTTPVRLQQMFDSYCVGDFFEGVQGVPSGSINWVELDPDFAIDTKDVMRGAAGSDNAYQEVTRDAFPVFFIRVLQQLRRVMVEHGYIICWYGFEWTSFVREAFLAEGFAVSSTPGIWLKDRVSGAVNQPYMNFDSQTELFMIARKGSPSLVKPGRSNVFVYPRLPSAEKAHPFERPLDLMKELLGTVAFPGTRGLVPFLGSGKTLIAAQHLDMTALGFELSQEYKNAYTVRLQQAAHPEWKLK